LLTVAAVIPILAFVYNWTFPLNIGSASYTPTHSQVAEIASQQGRLGGSHYTDRALQDASNTAFGEGFSAIALFCAVFCVLAALTDAAGIRESELRSD
jgi:hypothetical protein